MFKKKKWIILFLMLASVSGAISAMNEPVKKERNLKVLPKDISDQKLDSIMHSFNVALGVDCKFCHKTSNSFPFDMDYASDGEPMKESARNMLRMTIMINQTYFYFDKNERPEYLNTVHCNTCHKGDAMPQ